MNNPLPPDGFSGELKLTFFVAGVFFSLAIVTAAINFALSHYNGN